MSAHRYSRSTKKKDKNKPHPMAKPVKENKNSKVSAKNFKGNLFSFLLKFQKHLYLSVGFLIILVGLVSVYLTPVFLIKNINYDLKDSHGCLSEDQLSGYLKKKRVYPWSYLFFDSKTVSKKYSCLVSFKIIWNPLYFYSINIKIVGLAPVMKVVVVKTDISDATLGNDAYYSSNIFSEETKYLTKNGTVISIIDQTGMFTIRYRILKNDTADNIRISDDDIIKLFQIKNFMNKEYGVQVQPDVTSLGSVKLQLPFVENLYLSLRDDLQTQLGSLQAVLSTSTINKEKIKSIDLRYNNPVVRYN